VDGGSFAGKGRDLLLQLVDFVLHVEHAAYAGDGESLAHEVDDVADGLEFSAGVAAPSSGRAGGRDDALFVEAAQEGGSQAEPCRRLGPW
jgi:hypothetical protein